MKDVSAFRPRHWLLLVAGLSFVVNLAIGIYSYSMGAISSPVTDPWPTMFFLEVGLFARMVVVVSLVAYCVQWVVTLVSVITARHRSVSP
jgi:hypothetical protein